MYYKLHQGASHFFKRVLSNQSLVLNSLSTCSTHLDMLDLQYRTFAVRHWQLVWLITVAGQCTSGAAILSYAVGGQVRVTAQRFIEALCRGRTGGSAPRPRHYVEVSGHLHAPAALPPVPQNRSGYRGDENKPNVLCVDRTWAA
jgi:hypothetical protein